MGSGSLEHYAREVELLWSEFVERPVVLSPGDWRWITEWHRRGIPLELIVECIEEAAERRRRGSGARRPRGLSYLARALDEAWSVVVEGRTQPAVASAARAAAAALAAWRWRTAQEPAGSALRSLLERLIAELDAGLHPDRVDSALSRGLVEAVSPEIRHAAEREASDHLRSFRSRMRERQFDIAFDRAVVQRLRRRLQLPRLESVPHRSD